MAKKPLHIRSGLKDLRAFGRAHLDCLKDGGDYKALENSQCRKKVERVEKQFNFNFYKNTSTKD